MKIGVAGKIKFKKLDSKAVLPSRGSRSACGLDIYSVETFELRSGQRKAVRTGVAVEIPYGFYGRVAPRSGLAFKMGIDVLAGVIDSDFRGEIVCLLINLGEKDIEVRIGDRVAQLLIEKVAILTPEWGEELNETDRGNAAFGSTGR